MRVIRPENLDAAAQAIEGGKLVVVPTQRWYMVCADASNAQACDSIIKGKRRPSGKPLAYVASSPASCEDLFTLSPEARRLAAAFWPGDLALLLPWKNTEDAARHAAVGSPALVTIAPGILGDLALKVKAPLAATTANISGDAPERPWSSYHRRAGPRFSGHLRHESRRHRRRRSVPGSEPHDHR
ncbi:hypothetical protein GCM10029978_045590 [Actinoallomurus acanthiterrae]